MLEQILKTIVCENTAEFKSMNLQEILEDQMPGYDIVLVDIHRDHPEVVTDNVIEMLEYYTGSKIEDVQWADWESEDGREWIRVIAIKQGEDNE